MNKKKQTSIIEISKLSKAYTIGHQAQAIGTTTFRDTLISGLKKPLQFFTGAKMEKEKFWALKDVSLNIERGDTIGLIGRNGSGKSTLLKILSRIVEPTSGEAHLHGRTASLLEVGTGFHPELSGRENVFFNGAILGMGRKEISEKFDAIVEFSGVEKFLDTPVKFYSSGMYVRLAFAIAAHLDPEILIVDEVLAVGDAEFQRKSLGKMRDVTQDSDRTVIFVSHSMDSIQSICNKCAWLQDGKIKMFGATRDVVEAYIVEQNSASTETVANRTNRRGNGEVRLVDVQVKNNISKGRTVKINLEFDNYTETIFKDAKLSLDIYDTSGVHIANALNYTINSKIDYFPGRNKITFALRDISLMPGTYSANVFIASDVYNTNIFDWLESAVVFVVPPYDAYNKGVPPTNHGGLMYLDYDIKS